MASTEPPGGPAQARLPAPGTTFPAGLRGPEGRPALPLAHTGDDWLPGGGRGLPQPIGGGLVTAAEAAALG